MTVGNLRRRSAGVVFAPRYSSRVPRRIGFAQITVAAAGGEADWPALQSKRAAGVLHEPNYRENGTPRSPETPITVAADSADCDLPSSASKRNRLTVLQPNQLRRRQREP